MALELAGHDGICVGWAGDRGPTSLRVSCMELFSPRSFFFAIDSETESRSKQTERENQMPKGDHCCVPFCTSDRRKGHGLLFHSFPGSNVTKLGEPRQVRAEEKEVRAKWIHAYVGTRWRESSSCSRTTQSCVRSTSGTKIAFKEQRSQVLGWSRLPYPPFFLGEKKRTRPPESGGLRSIAMVAARQSSRENLSPTPRSSARKEREPPIWKMSWREQGQNWRMWRLSSRRRAFVWRDLRALIATSSITLGSPVLHLLMHASDFLD